jgi:hypothetical protein
VCVCVRLKKNGKDAKEISLICQGFQGYLEPEEKEMSDEPWIMKSDEIEAEHLLDRAPDDLRKG